ncbi:hypothetical protein ACWEOZ_05630 [Actinoplanes sp. NPDC004185]
MEVAVQEGIATERVAHVGVPVLVLIDTGLEEPDEVIHPLILAHDHRWDSRRNRPLNVGLLAARLMHRHPTILEFRWAW